MKQYIEANKERFFEELFSLLRIPSVSSLEQHKPDMHHCAERLVELLMEAGADEAVLKIKSLEAFERAADGKATKIIIPSDIQNMAGLIAGIKEVATDTPAAKSVASAPQKNTAKSANKTEA